MAMAPDRSLSLVHTTDHYADDEDDAYHSSHHSADIEGRSEGLEKKRDRCHYMEYYFINLSLYRIMFYSYMYNICNKINSFLVKCNQVMIRIIY